MRMFLLIILLLVSTGSYAQEVEASWWEKFQTYFHSFFGPSNSSRDPSSEKNKRVVFDFYLNREIREEECSSGEWFGLDTSSKERLSGSDGAAFSVLETRLIGNTPYLRSFTENNISRTVEVNDNIYYFELLERYPTLTYPRQDGFYIRENHPKITNVTYLKDENGDPLTPQRTWWYDTFGRNGNQLLKLEDNPLKIIKDSRGRVIRTEEQDSPKLLRIFEFFPRKQVADAKVIEENGIRRIRMTLPTGEEVIFDGETGVVLSGAFKSEARSKAEYQKGPYLYNPTNPRYIGSGVWIEIDETNKKVNSRQEFDDKGAKNFVNVYKNNPLRKCTIASNEIWTEKYGQRSSQEDGIAFHQARGVVDPAESSYEYLNTSYRCFFLKYRTDEEMDAFFKAKCGFGFLP